VKESQGDNTGRFRGLFSPGDVGCNTPKDVLRLDTIHIWTSWKPEGQRIEFCLCKTGKRVARNLAKMSQMNIFQIGIEQGLSIPDILYRLMNRSVAVLGSGIELWNRMSLLNNVPPIRQILAYVMEF